MGRKAVKFGGTSLCDAAQMKKAAEIVLSDAERQIIVVSAPGKRTPKDEKITDLLIRMDVAKTLSERKKIFSIVCDRFDTMIKMLSLPIDFREEYADILENFKGDALISRGEYFCARIFAALLGFTFVDASDAIFFQKDGSLDVAKTRAHFHTWMVQEKHIVLPGFYGSDFDGKIKVFPRGGSDITGAIAADAGDASLYENFTDVNGFLLADPKIVSDPKTVPVLSYHALRRLSSMGASVFHADAVLPLYEKKIPVLIRNTNLPEGAFTTVLPQKKDRSVDGIVGQKGYTLFSVYAPSVGENIDDFQRLLSLFGTYTSFVYSTPRTIDACGFLVRNEDVASEKETIIQKIYEEFHAHQVVLTENMALLSIIGEYSSSQNAGLLLQTMDEIGAEALLLDGGADRLGITVGFDADYLQDLIRRLYGKLEKIFFDV